MNKAERLEICGVILAAGKGTRMQSDLPKVLHKIAEKTLLQRVVDTLNGLGLGGVCVVLGGDLERFSEFMRLNEGASVCQQLARQGTGDAVAATCDYFKPVVRPAYARGQVIKSNNKSFSYILVCAGDAPAVNGDTLLAFMSGMLAARAKIAVLGMEHPEPKGYGRIVCDAAGDLLKIVEEKNTTPDEKKIQLCNTGVIFAEKEFMFSCLADVTPNSLSNEYYLTDCFEIAKERGERVYVHRTSDFHEFDGVNDPEQLRKLTEWLHSQGRL